MGVDATKPSVLDSTGATSGRGRAPARAELSQGVLGWLFVAPIVVVIVVLVGYPLLLSLQMSAQDVAIYPGEQTKWVGLDNYRSLLGADSTLSAAIHTLGYWLIAVSVELGIGMAAALALWHPFRGRGVVLALLVLPWALPPVVSGLLWTRIFDPTSGSLNGVLYQLGLIDHYRIWFSDPGSTIGLVALVHAWGLVPLVTLILLGGLQGIPSELFEAAHIDGASRVSGFRYITLPLLRPSIVAALAIGTVVAFGIFDVIYVLVGTDRDARSVMMQIYLTTFGNLDFGHGAALAVMLSLASILISVPVHRASTRAVVVKAFRVSSIPQALTLAFVLVWTLSPIYIGVMTSLSTRTSISDVPPHWFPSPINLDGYAALLPGATGEGTSDQFFAAFVNSVKLAGIATSITLTLSVLSGYAFARLRFRGRRVVLLAVVGTIVIPLFLLIVPLFRLMSQLHLIGTLPGVIALYVAAYTPLGIWLFYNYVRDMPVELEEAARVDGCSRFQAFRKVVLPQMRGGIAALTAILLLSTWGEFTIPLIFASNAETQPLTVIITQFVGKYSLNVPVMMAAGVLSMLLPAVIALVLARHIRQMLGGWGH